MSKTIIRSFSRVRGVQLEGDKELVEVALVQLKTAIPLAMELVSSARTGKKFDYQAKAATSAVHVVSALFSMLSPKCDKAQPAEDIDVVTDGNGDLVMRCRHNPAHKWSLSGKSISDES